MGMLKKIGIGFAILLVLAMLGSMFDSEGESQPAESPAAVAESPAAGTRPAPSAVPSQEPAPDWASGVPLTEESVRAALAAVKDGAIPTTEKLDAPTAISVATDTGTISLSYKPEALWNEQSYVGRGADTAFSAMRYLFRNPSVQTVTVTMLADWTDQYGNTKESPSTAITINRATADKINWDGIEDQVMIEDKHLYCIADKPYIHPAITLKMDELGCLSTVRNLGILGGA